MKTADRFQSEENGTIAIIFGLMVLPIAAVAVASFEFSQVYALRANTQSAVDAAAVAIGRAMDQGKSKSEAEAIGRKVFSANISSRYTNTQISRFTMDQLVISHSANGEITVSQKSTLKNSAMDLVHMNEIPVTVSSTIVAASRDVEIVLVLDNSGSMGSSMGELKEAACNLVRTIYGVQEENEDDEEGSGSAGGTETGSTDESETDPCDTTDIQVTQNQARIRMGLVPFAASVNIGSSNRGQAFMDMNGQSPIHTENFMYSAFTMDGSRTTSGSAESYSSSADLFNGTATQTLTPVPGVTSPSARAQLEYQREFPTRNRWDLFDAMGVTWGGCVEGRPGVHGVSDTPADSADPSSLFVPMFAPDEPDPVDSTSDQNNKQNLGKDFKSYYNSYLNDRPSACPQPQAYQPGVEGQEEITELRCTRRESRRSCRRRHSKSERWRCDNKSYRQCTKWQRVVVQEYIPDVPEVPAIDVWLSPEKAQAQTCKYGNFRNPNDYSKWWGPNYYCTTKAVTALNTDATSMLTKIGEMEAAGYTNIPQGLVWGWRVLSPGAPFTESQLDPNGKPVNQIVILLSDGRNEIGGMDNHNHSPYFAWGYGAKGRLDPNTIDYDTFNARMNDKLVDVCTNIAATDIIVYTVGFNLNDATTQGLLNNCAGAAANNRAFVAGSSDPDKPTLNETFAAIAQSIQDLRISK